uniref:Beta-defensin 132 n=1 Tax=Garrulax canorus TaxID=238855 RepID=A0A3G1AZD8_9PASS|nr:beta-defensin 132 [Garrulax canorus]AJW76472.1 beta-defensin 132 [Garrulax canorus]
MKILLLLLPLILLLVQGAAGSPTTCWRNRGICSKGLCPHGTIPRGRCARDILCCKR